MYKIILKYLSIIFFISFINHNCFAITGKEISNKISDWLLLEGVEGNPIFSKTKIYNDCKSDYKISKTFNNYKTIKIQCPEKDGLLLFVRVDLKKSKIKKNSERLTKNKSFSNSKSFKRKEFILVKLNKSLEKNSVLEFEDLEIFSSKKISQKSFFNNKEDLVGRKLKKNLKMGQLLHPRHLYEKFEIKSGDFLSIVSNIGNASVTVSGEAQDSGNLGDLIKVKNLRSGKIIKGYIKKNKIIKVFR